MLAIENYRLFLRHLISRFSNLNLFLVLRLVRLASCQVDAYYRPTRCDPSLNQSDFPLLFQNLADDFWLTIQVLRCLETRLLDNRALLINRLLLTD